MPDNCSGNLVRAGRWRRNEHQEFVPNRSGVGAVARWPRRPRRYAAGAAKSPLGSGAGRSRRIRPDAGGTDGREAGIYSPRRRRNLARSRCDYQGPGHSHANRTPLRRSAPVPPRGVRAEAVERPLWEPGTCERDDAHRSGCVTGAGSAGRRAPRTRPTRRRTPLREPAGCHRHGRSRNGTPLGTGGGSAKGSSSSICGGTMVDHGWRNSAVGLECCAGG